MRPGLAEWAAAAIGAAARLSAAKRGIALVYHRIGPIPGDPRRELVPALDAATFERHLRHLARHYRLVSASELPDAVARRTRGQRYPVALTFDDDLPSHVSDALPVLRRAGAPATFFLSGASLEAPAEFWWEKLQRAADGGRVPGDIHSAALEITSKPPQEQESVIAELEAEVGPPPEEAGMREADVRRLVADGFEIGFHTLRHYPLPLLDDGELAEAMVEGRERLSATAGAALESIAYPHGEADARVAAAARTAGFRLGFTTTRGAVSSRTDPVLLPRLEPPRSIGRFGFALARLLLGP